MTDADAYRTLALVFDAPDDPGAYDAWVEAYDREAAAIRADMDRPVTRGDILEQAARLGALGLHDEAARWATRHGIQTE